MNTFHEINMMTSRGDIHGAFSLIRDRSESVARKIMKKAGYSVPAHTGRAFWVWVQETLLTSSRKCRNGYQVRAERDKPARGYRQQMQEDYETWAQMMSQPAHVEETASNEPTTAKPAEKESNITAVSASLFRAERILKCHMTKPLNMKIRPDPAIIQFIPDFCSFIFLSLFKLMWSNNILTAVYNRTLLLNINVHLHSEPARDTG